MGIAPFLFQFTGFLHQQPITNSIELI